MSLVKVSALRSKDPNTKVGAVLVDYNNRVIGLGYNGMPHGDDTFPWIRESEKISDTKYPYVVHAEMNAFLNSRSISTNFRIYTSLFPCSSCAKFLSQAGVKEVVYDDDLYKGTEDNKIAKKIFAKAKIKVRKLKTFTLIIE